jgi:transcriptional regulator with XRE-family HTH domain
MTAGHALKSARFAAGMTLDDVVYESRRLLPRVLWITKSKLSRVENSEVAEDKIEPHMVEFLCSLYGVEVDEISPLIAGELRAYRTAVKRAALTRSRCDSLGAQRPLPFDDASVTDVEVSWPSEGTGSVTYVTDLLASPEELARVYAGADLDIRSDHVLVGAA